MVEVRWTAQSLEDINNISEFIAKDSEKYASIQVKRFFELAEILEHQPTSGRVVPEFQDETLRELILGNYRLIYLIVSKTRIDILTVHHSRRLLLNNPAFKTNK
jgi:toxin ParE1/3/4